LPIISPPVLQLPSAVAIFSFSKAKIRVQILHLLFPMGDNYQLAIVGSGSGGRAATRLAAQNGLHTALIEKIASAENVSIAAAMLSSALQASARQFVIAGEAGGLVTKSIWSRRLCETG